MRPDFSNLTIDTTNEIGTKQTENQDTWNTPEGIPVKSHFTKEDIKN